MATPDNLAVAGYERVGSVVAPANTTAGDLTAERISVGDTAFTAGVVFQVDSADGLALFDYTQSRELNFEDSRSGLQSSWPYWAYPDEADTTFYCQPTDLHDWVSGDITIEIGYVITVLVAGTVIFQAHIQARKSTGVIGAAEETIAISAGVPGTTSTINQVSGVFAAANITQDDVAAISLQRDAAHASDDYAGEARVLYVNIRYRARDVA
jgi:hypothetical protein